MSEESYLGTAHYSNRHNDVVLRASGPETDEEMEAMRRDRVMRCEEPIVFALLNHRLGVVKIWFVDEIPDVNGKTGSKILNGAKYLWLLKEEVFPLLRETLGDRFDTMI